MSIPHYINEDKSHMRGIKPGWYQWKTTENSHRGRFLAATNA
jgi:hypothetical protein